MFKVKGFLLGFTYAAFGFFPAAYADDTEIYFGGGEVGTPVETRPNILFMVDTSGSMNASLGTKTRMEVLQEALSTVVAELNNVNIGLGRYNTPGGSILHGVKYIDDVVAGEASTIASVDASDDDGINLVSTGAVITDGAEFSLGEGPYPITSSVFGVADVDHDLAEEFVASGNMVKMIGTTPTSNDLELMYDEGSAEQQIIGLRYQNVAIDPGALIRTATLRFTDNTAASGTYPITPLTMNIYGEEYDYSMGAGPNAYGVAPFDISTRAKTPEVVAWTHPARVPADTQFDSADISSVVQSAIDDPGWASGKKVAFIMEEHVDSEGGRRNAYKTGGRDPKLVVEWGHPAYQAAGIRFSEVNIPSEAQITSAKIVFTAAASHDDDASFTVKGVKDSNPAAFDALTSDDIRSRAETVSAVTWDDVEPWEEDSTYDSADLSEIVQELVNDPGWCGGNAMAFKFTGTGMRMAKAYDAGTGVAKLHVSYDISGLSSGQGCARTQVSAQITANSDDAEQRSTSNKDNTAGSTLDIDSGNDYIGVRFRGVNVPQGATISSAFLEFTGKSSGDSDPLTLEVYGHKVGDADRFRHNNTRMSNRTPVTTKTDWVTSAWDNNQAVRSPDIATAVQEIVGLGAWAPGNDMVYILKYKSGSGERNAHSRDDEAIRAPRLIINYQDTVGDSGTIVTVRNDILNQIEDLPTAGWTPLIEAYYEGARYYRGEGVDFGKTRGTSSSYRKTNRVSHPNSWTGGVLERDASCTDSNLNSTNCASEQITGSPTYTTPIEYSCQENHIVMLTDGEPTGGNSRISQIQSMTGETCSSIHDNDGKCGEEMAEFLATHDQSDDIETSQTLKTHTIAFGNDLSTATVNWLASMAAKGQGTTHHVDSTSSEDAVAELASAFRAIAGEVMDTDTSFAAPAISVNQFNRLIHRSEIYYAMFKPKSTAFWRGNVKKFGLKVVDGAVEIVDASGAPAVDTDTGGFKTSSQSYWSPTIDGNSVPEGGVASKLPSYDSPRKVYVYHSSSDSKNLTSNDNKLVSVNSEITKEMLGIPSESADYRQRLLDWVNGKDIWDVDGDNDNTDTRYEIADPLHSKPVVVTYDADPNNDNDGSDALYYLFFGTNDGLFHAVNGQTGEEKFAIAMENMLPNLNTYFLDGAALGHTYGLDGEPTMWIRDVDYDGKIEPTTDPVTDDDSDRVFAYIGQRRGGRNYYAFDLSKINEPKVMWQIEGGTGDFAELGQTWSKPLLMKIRYKNGSDVEVKRALLIGGGYDPAQDGVNARTPDGMGRAVYLVDALTGERLWHAAIGGDTDIAEMKYSISSDISATDTNEDGFVDAFFVGDMGGQVLRFDIDTTGSKRLTDSDYVRGGVIADLAEDGTATGNRRFYHPLDVGFIRKDGIQHWSLMIGSGYRAHPLDETIEDRFYSIKQELDAPESSYEVITEADLFDTTDNLIAEGTDAQQQAAQESLSDSSGWYIRLTNLGEKVLSKPLTINNSVIFTTYEPESAVIGCEPVPGISRQYTVSAFDGRPTAVGDDDSDTNGDGDVDIDDLRVADRSTIIETPGIIDDVTIVQVEPEDSDVGEESGSNEGAVTGCFLGTQRCELDFPADSISRTYWYTER